MSRSNLSFQELQDELMALFDTKGKRYAPYPGEDPGANSCVKMCGDGGWACAETCPDNETPEGRKCVLACGRGARECMRKCRAFGFKLPPVLEEIDAVLQAMERVVTMEEAGNVEDP